MTRPLFRDLSFLARFFVFTLVFSLSLPAVADAFLTRGGKPQPLSGMYIHSGQQQTAIPHDFIEFSNGTVTAVDQRHGTLKGKYSITGDTIEFVFSDGRITAFKFSRTPNAIMLSNGGTTTTFVLASSERLAAIEAARKAEEEVRKLQEAAKSAGFIAISDTSMTWADAKTFCQQQGGKLPLIGGKEALGSEAYTQGVSIDGFGRSGASWPAGLPRGDYWTGTQGTDGPGFSWIVGVYGGVVSVTNCLQSNQRRVVCVP